ncbi:WxL protein peptidoglycan domain-containing protein [Planococcus sp. X10-3]|uniref:WxL protein peptidoglycan domain-containing protein n=1 Tax=Planococcus sp. X10-3 TaxID=3061240 RepID=UPI003BB18E3C
MFTRILIIALLLLTFPLHASAAPSSLQVEPIYPDNQVPETKGYFDVNATAGEQVNLKLKLQNTEDIPITVRVEKSNAYTSPTGGIFYELAVDSEDTMLLDNAILLADIMDTEETVSIPANESIDFPIQVTVPQTDAQTLLGGIKVTQMEEAVEEEGEELGEDEANFVLKTELTYAIAIQLNLPTESEPNFSTGNAGFIAPTAQVFLEVSNNAHLIQGDVEWTYSVLDSAGTELFNGAVNTFNMAPKSKIRFPVAWNHEELADGKYTLVANGHAGEQVIATEEPFEISNEAVEEYAEIVNPTPVVNEGDGIPVWVWIGAAIVFGIIMFLAGRRKKT